MKKNLEDVFVTEGVPLYTFVKPPNYNEILIDIRKAGKPVIIEGQSGTGKTTTIRKILDQLIINLEIKYLSARKTVDVEEIIRISIETPSGYFVIDDFHRLSAELQEKMANIAKLAAEEGDTTKLPKLIIIGINQIGSELIQIVPDIAKRCGIHKISSGTYDTTLQLIERGSKELNVEIDKINEIFNESKGDYWLTQSLCQAICSLHEVTETVHQTKKLNVDLDKSREKVVEKLSAAFNTPVKEFCRGKRFRKSNDPYFKLLHLIGQQESSIVDLNKLANKFDEFKGSINNIKERRLDILLASKESLNRYFYYNSDTKNFVIEDPALFYYIKHLNWDILREDCGFNEGAKDFEFDIAISFAGENRDLAKQITEKLEIFDVSVFYDALYEANFLGKALSKQFIKIFNDESRYVLCVLDKYHQEKVWPTFEREIFKKRIIDEAVIPLYLDDSIFVGVPDDLYGFDMRKGVSEDKIDEMIIKLVEKIS